MKSPVLFLAATIAAALIPALPAAAQIPAFPGAEGFGGFAKGGRGGDVYIVTNLNASGAGSFRNGIETVPAAGRTIVFAVSGHIHINGLRLVGSKVTIAGQTAPGDGVGLVDGTFRISGDDVVVRHLRFRHRKSGSGGDCVNLDSGSINSVLDSVSMMFSTDENFSSFGSPPENLTMQWSLNAWGLESHSCGGLWDQNHATAHHTLWAHNHTRNPKARPGGLLEWINNVTFDWDIGFIMGDSETPASWKANVLNSYFLCPPGNLRSKALEKANLDRNGVPNFSIYLSNNRHDNDGDGLLNGTDKGYGIASGSYTTLAAPVANTGAIPVTIDDPVVAFKKVVSKAGALRLDIDPAKPLRDEVDARLINNLVTQTANHITRESDLAGVSNGGIGTLNSTAAPVDTDKDGMPDFYEEALGWNKAVQDHNTALANSGGFVTGSTFLPPLTPAGAGALDKYTRLEEYLHYLAIPHGTVAKFNTGDTATSVQVDLRKFTSGFSASPTFTVANISGGGVALTGTGNAIATFTPTAGYSGRARFDFTVTSAGHTWTQTCAIVVTNAGLPRDIIWKGVGTTWDTATPNWLRPATGATVAFSSPDRVTFDQSGVDQPNIVLSGPLAPGTVEVNAAGNYKFDPGGNIDSSGTLTKRGSGTLTINNGVANSFSAVSLDEGLLSLTNFNAAGTGKISLNGGSLFLSTAIGNPLEFNTPTTITVGSQQTMTGNWTGTQTLTLKGTTAHLWSVSGTWTGFTGAINFDSGNVRMRLNGGNSNSMYGSPAVAINLGSGTSQLMNRNGSATIPFELGSLESSGTGTVLSGTQTGAVNSTYSIGALGTNKTFAGSIVNGGTTTNITKVGTGAWTLSGTSTYTGTTTVSNGALIVDGALGNTAVTVAGNALLAGDGPIGGTVTASAGAFLSPGTAPFTGATLAVGNGLTLNGSTLYFDMSGTISGPNDRITLSGGLLAMTGAQYFQFLLLAGSLAEGTYDLITGAASISASGFTLTHNLPVGGRQTFSVAPVGNVVRLTVTGDPATLTWTGTTSAAWDAATAGNFTGATPNTFGANDAVIFDDTTAIRTVAVTGSIAPRSIVVNTTAGYTFAGPGTIDGPASLTKNGPGTLTFAGLSANTFTGGLTLNAGTINFASDDASNGALGNGPVTLNGGTLSMFSAFSNSFDSFTAALVVPTGATATFNADARVDIFGSLAGGGTLNLSIPSNRTSLYADWSAFSGVLEATTASGYAELRSATNYNPAGYANAIVNLGNNVTAVHVGNINQGAGTTIAFGALSGTASSRLLGGPDFAGGRLLTYRIGGRGTDAIFAGTIAEQNPAVTNTSIVKTGAGLWTLSGSGAWNGSTTVEQGTLKIAGAFTCASTTNVEPGATLQFAGGSLSTDALNIAQGAFFLGNGTVIGDLNNDGTVTALTGGSLAVTGAVVNNGLMRIAGGTLLSATGGFVNNGTLDLLTGVQALPPNLENNGLIIDSSTLAMSSASKTGNTVTVIVPTHSGHTYQLQRSAALTTPVWQNVGSVQAGLTQLSGAPTNRIFTDPAATGTQFFYRAVVTP